MSRGARIVFIDARRRDFDDFKVRLPGALHVPALEAAQHLNSIPSDYPIVAYCT
jgi:rhodanese-related sulfurtransferase